MGCWLTLGRGALGAHSQLPPPGSPSHQDVVCGPLGNLGTGPCHPGPLPGSPSQGQLVAQVLGVLLSGGFYMLTEAL